MMYLGTAVWIYIPTRYLPNLVLIMVLLIEFRFQVELCIEVEMPWVELPFTYPGLAPLISCGLIVTLPG
ncbi:hypothetical protein EDB80DRAFT_697277 [Ilyonectria destructans]|nr:hypothetical protein EDB80DRAFT_697277 [Ilyonectria destructans]